MRKLTPVFASLVLAVASCGSASSEKDAHRTLQIPMKLVKRTPVLVVAIGDKEVPLQLDLGSGTTLTLYPQIVDQLDAQATGKTHVSIGMEGIAMENPEYTVPTVKLGAATFSDLVVRKDDHSEQHRADTIEYRGTYGHVGRGLFDSGKLIVDYKNERITILPTDAPDEDQAACSGIEVPIETEKASLGLATKVRTDIGELYAVWDTGAGGNIMLKRTTDAAGLSLNARDKFRTDTFEMNGHEFGPVRMNVWDVPAFPPDLHTLLGYWFFADKIVCIDFPRNRLLVQVLANETESVD